VNSTPSRLPPLPLTSTVPKMRAEIDSRVARTLRRESERERESRRGEAAARRVRSNRSSHRAVKRRAAKRRAVKRGAAGDAGDAKRSARPSRPCAQSRTCRSTRQCWHSSQVKSDEACVPAAQPAGVIDARCEVGVGRRLRAEREAHRRHLSLASVPQQRAPRRSKDAVVRGGVTEVSEEGDARCEPRAAAAARRSCDQQGSAIGRE
jgi:hypothetical protein